MSDPIAAVTLVTPDMAREWLEQNTRNRVPKRTSIEKFTRDMGAGNWKLTGEAIKFAPDGRLLDGQNRLMACVKANVAFRTYVLRGIEDDAQKLMDTGSARTAADSLSIAGEPHASILAATAKLGVALAADADANPDKYAASYAQLEAFIQANDDLRKVTEFASRVARKTDCPPSVVAYTTWVFMRLDENDAFAFWTAAAEKVGLVSGDPVIALTDRFAESRRRKERVHKRGLISAIYRAWNYRRCGVPLKTIRFNSPGGGLVPIPEPK